MKSGGAEELAEPASMEQEMGRAPAGPLQKDPAAISVSFGSVRIFVGFCCSQPSPPFMGMGAVEKEGYCGASVARVWLVRDCIDGF